MEKSLSKFQCDTENFLSTECIMAKIKGQFMTCNKYEIKVKFFLNRERFRLFQSVISYINPINKRPNI